MHRQTLTVPMGTNCAPLAADLFLFCYLLQKKDYVCFLAIHGSTGGFLLPLKKPSCEPKLIILTIAEADGDVLAPAKQD